MQHFPEQEGWLQVIVWFQKVTDCVLVSRAMSACPFLAVESLGDICTRYFCWTLIGQEALREVIRLILLTT